jgi:hypothetical protein
MCHLHAFPFSAYKGRVTAKPDRVIGFDCLWTLGKQQGVRTTDRFRNALIFNGKNKISSADKPPTNLFEKRRPKRKFNYFFSIQIIEPPPKIGQDSSKGCLAIHGAPKKICRDRS